MKSFVVFISAVILCFQSNASELFIRVVNNQEHYVSVQGQTQYNPKNTFRFFELAPGSVSITITNRTSGKVLSTTSLVLANNERVVAEVILNGAFQIQQRTMIQEVNWYTSYDLNAGSFPNNGYPNGGYPNPPLTNPNYPNNGYPNGAWNGINYVNETTFQQFMVIIRDESMDNNRLKNAENFVSMNALSSTQIAEIAKEFSFDSNRLTFAKAAYKNCYDKGNYFLLKETFSFSSNYNSLLKFINGK